MTGRPRSRRFPALTVVATAAAMVATSGCSARFGVPEPATEQGEEILSLWRVLFWAAVGVGGVVVALLAWSLVRYRARGRTDLPVQTKGNFRLEVVYTAIPLAVAGALFALSVKTEADTSGREERADVVVDVTGFQWQWRFTYPALGVSVLGVPGDLPELVLPVGRVTRLRLRSPDVVHSFYVPGFLNKRDAVPGDLTNEMTVHPVRRGVYGGHCAEFCGFDHARMNFRVRVVDDDEFARWVAAQRRVG
ncbi:MAG: cytochrome c oxidase subunit II [Actinomycetota bacterium]|nr:cytochrome c oxidase subunit II [Actinomycetota bacterium]